MGGVALQKPETLLGITTMRKIAFGFAAVAAVVATPALAATASNTMPVSVNVTNACTVAATPMSFGAPTSIGGSNINSTSTITLVCTNGANYDVALDNGTHASGSQRNMQFGTATIPYNVYRDAGRTASWGATSGTDTVSGTMGATGTFSLIAYGQIPSSATSVGAGTYTDTITVTVTF